MGLPLGVIQVAVVAFITTPFAIGALLLRLWSRYLQGLALVFNDYMAIVAMVLAAGAVSVFLAAGFAAGLGVHLDVILATDPAEFALHMRLFVPAQLLWAAANSSVKLSILSLYTTLFADKKFCRVCYATMAVTMAYFTMVFLETFLLCKPVQYNWDKSIKGTCTGENTAYLVAGITNLVIDTFIVILPMPSVFRLRMTLSRRISVAAMFSLGAIICIMSLMRVIWLANWNLADLTYTETAGSIYSVLEPTLGVVNACLPTLRPAMNEIFGSRPLSWTRRGSSNKNLPGETSSQENKHNRNGQGAVKGNITRDLERLDDELPLHEVRVEHFKDRSYNQANTITVDTEFRVHSIEESA
ncbi:hypothetical protein VPNG_08079 [Cytospora leucostoma]|uniref:Rhodopsin domain-containing protein n=1 Tax=Cytospora leucostoma TaxID=1230097 RepID=A0A423WS34_9PEZI|nr:hypothetical protein VPNG_08079 [Cytospora leucostoma]